MAFPWIRWSCSFRCLRILLWRNTILPSTRSTITTTIRTTMMPSASASVSAWAWQNCVESNSSEAITIMFLLMIIIYIVYGCKYTAFLWHIQVFTVRKHYRFSTFCYQNVWFIVVIWNKSCNFATVKWQEMIQIDEKTARIIQSVEQNGVCVEIEAKGHSITDILITFSKNSLAARLSRYAVYWNFNELLFHGIVF